MKKKMCGKNKQNQKLCTSFYVCLFFIFYVCFVYTHIFFFKQMIIMYILNTDQIHMLLNVWQRYIFHT